MYSIRLVAWFLVLAVAVRASAADTEPLPDGVTIHAITIWPEQITLRQPWDVAQVLITGQAGEGEQVDLTRIAKLVSEPTLVEVNEHAQVTPRGDGQETLRFELDGHVAEVKVSVEGLGRPHDVSYTQDVTPGLSKMGCNSGTCHGSKDGQRGFKLSLRGYDFQYDHRALTDDIGARRFNRANPEQSLMLLKASGAIAHVGGVLTRPGERHYELLKRWIAGGATLDLDAPRVAKIDLFPQNPILPRANQKQQMVVLATYTDGSVRDVTADSFVSSGNIEVAETNDRGIVLALRRGEAPILARYEGAYTATTVTIMGDRSRFAWQQPPSFNYIDDLVYSKLQRMKISPSELCADHEFVRRVYLDLTGLPPTSQQVRAFLSDATESRVKRSALVDHLIGSEAFVEHWTNKWADLLQVNRKFLGELGSAALRSWIQNAIATNMPYDQFAHQILTARGSTLDNPAAAYWKVLREPAEAMENTTHLFLAVRFNCNKCHDHPFERWTQDQYYHMSAFFAQVGRKEDPQFAGQRIGGSAVENAQPLVEVIYDASSGETVHDRTGQVSPPQFPYGDELVSQELSDAARRDRLAAWMTSADNQYFASSYANRLWGYLLGVGLIEPIDDIRAGNPPTNPELLKALTEDFVQSGFDVRHMLRTICNSRVYQHSVETNEWNDDDTINYSHALPRRLPAEVLYDAIHLASGARPNIPGVPAGLRAAQIPDSGVSLPFLDDFGRPPRESACECERSSGIVLGPIMKLINGPTVNDALADPQNQISQLVEREADDEAVVEEIFLRFLARHPTPAERQFGIETLHAARNDEQLALGRLAEYEQQLGKRFQTWLSELPRPAVWQSMQVDSATSQAGAELAVDSEARVRVTGTLAQDVYTIQGRSALTQLSGLRLQALPDPSLSQGGPGRAENGNFVVNEIELWVRTPQDAEAQRVPLRQPVADFSQSGWDVAGAIDGNLGSGWAIMPEFNKAHDATFEVAEPRELPEGTEVTVKIVHQHDDGKHNLGLFRLDVTDSPQPFGTGNLPAAIAGLAATPADQRTPEQLQGLRRHFFELDAEYQRLNAALKLAGQQARQHRLTGAQDLAWALINTPAFLFNR
jgi:hypothetical protein